MQAERKDGKRSRGARQIASGTDHNISIGVALSPYGLPLTQTDKGQRSDSELSAYSERLRGP